uniref:C-type lectin domain family 4 member E n=1 Tax=Sus scrofa TaxID=9823 RepID=A0A8D0TVM0_PIG
HEPKLTSVRWKELLRGQTWNCCPLNWIHFQSSCYFFSTNVMSWTASLKNCSSIGAHLVVINTQEEQEFLFHAKPKRKEFYIGLTDQVIEGQWKWVDGTPFTTSLSFWDIGEPNNHQKKTCIFVTNLQDRVLWRKFSCNLESSHRCKIPDINFT